jgi:hypothetical protein
VVALEARKSAERRRTATGAGGADEGAQVVVWPSIAALAFPLMSGRCPRWTSTTSGWGAKLMTRRRTVTEQAGTAAIEQGCRMLRVPTIRDRFGEIAATAEREQLSYLGFCRSW